MKVRYKHNFEKVMLCKGVALVWQDEIVMDLKYAGTKYGEKILEHERKHFEYITPMFRHTSILHWVKTVAINNIWDFLSSLKISVLYGDVGDRVGALLEFAVIAFLTGYVLGIIF